MQIRKDASTREVDGIPLWAIEEAEAIFEETGEALNPASLVFGASLANGAGKSSRRALDYYPTPPDATHALMQFPGPFDSMWEPACGTGEMSEVLAKYGTVYSTDIRETGYGIGNRDFLRESKLLAPIIITNPPFAESEDFIRHALALGAPTIAMLLKSQYWHAAKRIELFKEHAPAWVLPLTWRPDFLFGERGNSPTMECLWTVWEAGVFLTRYELLPRPHVKFFV